MNVCIVSNMKATRTIVTGVSYTCTVHQTCYSTAFFFFKQKTAYEMSASLVGSEMCIRDRTTGVSMEGTFSHP